MNAAGSGPAATGIEGASAPAIPRRSPLYEARPLLQRSMRPRQGEATKGPALGGALFEGG
jgi:hypothetical protein